MSKKALDNTYIQKLRDEVKNGKNKIQVAMKYNISYYLVKKHTQDIPTILSIPKELQLKIRQKYTWFYVISPLSNNH